MRYHNLLFLALGVILAITFSVLAFQNPSQDPPAGGGLLYTSGQNVVTQQHLFVRGKLRVGESGSPKGIELFDESDGSSHCLRVVNNALVLTDGDCPL